MTLAWFLRMWLARGTGLDKFRVSRMLFREAWHHGRMWPTEGDVRSVGRDIERARARLTTGA